MTGSPQPFWPALASARSVLLAGMGGGYDVVGAVPIAIALENAGTRVHFASLSFSALDRLAPDARDADVPTMYAVQGRHANEDVYCPEAWLARWLGERAGGVVWSFEKTGVLPLRRAYETLVKRLGIDTVVLVDGGIDSLLRGNESSVGTPEEDYASLAAIEALEGPRKLLACVGLGAELRDGICHEQVFERIAALTREGAFLGAEMLNSTTEAGRAYTEAVEFCFAHQQQVRRSHIHDVVLASLRGEYSPVGDGASFDRRGPHVWLSPLLGMYWYFDAMAVARANLVVPFLRETETMWDVTVRVEAVRKSLPIKARSAVPL